MLSTTVLEVVTCAALGAAPWIVGHRGAGSESHTNPYPENTLPSIRAAFMQGADMVEVDVVLDRNGVPILWHDKHIEVDGQREEVRELALAELPIQEGGTGIRARIPTFWDALRLALHLGTARYVMDVEIKVHDDEDRAELVAAIVGVLVEQNAVDRVLISSIDLESLNLIEAALPGIESGFIAILLDRMHTLLNEGEYPIEWLLVQHRWRVGSASQQALVERARANGLRIGAWTVNSGPRIRQLADSGYELIITDHSDVARRVLGAGYSDSLARYGRPVAPHECWEPAAEFDYRLDPEIRFEHEWSPEEIPFEAVPQRAPTNESATDALRTLHATLPVQTESKPNLLRAGEQESRVSERPPETASTSDRIRRVQAQLANRRRAAGGPVETMDRAQGWPRTGRVATRDANR